MTKTVWEVWRKLNAWTRVSSHRSEDAALESAYAELRSRPGIRKEDIEIRQIVSSRLSNYSPNKDK